MSAPARPPRQGPSRLARGLSRTATLAGAIRKAAAATGPWPLSRGLRATAAVAVAVAVARWSVTADPALGGIFELPAVGGLGLLAVALARGRIRLLAPAVGLLALSAGLAVAAASPAVATVAGVGAGLVAVLELSRWSIERRVNPPGEGGAELRRWLHLSAVLGVGWLAGIAVLAAAAGLLAAARWQVGVAAAAAVALAAVVAAAARGQR